MEEGDTVVTSTASRREQRPMVYRGVCGGLRPSWGKAVEQGCEQRTGGGWEGQVRTAGRCSLGDLDLYIRCCAVRGQGWWRATEILKACIPVPASSGLQDQRALFCKTKEAPGKTYGDRLVTSTMEEQAEDHCPWPEGSIRRAPPRRLAIQSFTTQSYNVARAGISRHFRNA